MAEDFDVEALLEAPYNPPVISSAEKTNGHGKSSSPYSSELDKSHKKRSHSRSRSKERKSRKRSRSRERKRSRSRERRRSRSRERRRSRSRERKSRRSRSRERRRRSRSKSHGRSHRSPVRNSDKQKNREDKFLEEADKRTVFCMQLAARVRPRDLEEFFSAVGKVREVRLIMDNRTRKHKGIAYIEYRESSSVPLALGLNGQRLCGYPILIQPTQAVKNKTLGPEEEEARKNEPRPRPNAPNRMMAPIYMLPPNASKNGGPMRLYVGSLHFNITEDMLRGIFDPFGSLLKVELMRDPETLRSKGFGFVTFVNPDDAKKALEQMNGFELAGRPMKVNHVTERASDTSSILSSDRVKTLEQMDRPGIELGAGTRLQLMAKLAEGTGIQLPQAATEALKQYNEQASMNAQPIVAQQPAQESSAQAIATQCFLLTNMFDPAAEEGENWPEEIRSDVIEECRNHGGALHVYVDQGSQGNVYIKSASVDAAANCVSALHGRWFSGRLVTAAYVPVDSYHQLFADAASATSVL